MPLFEKTRIEVYLPDLPAPAYRRLLDTFEQEFTYTFGGCTIIHGLSGSYLSLLGFSIPDRVNLLYTDAPFALSDAAALLSRYTDELREAAFQALEEESILVVAWPVYHSG